MVESAVMFAISPAVYNGKCFKTADLLASCAVGQAGFAVRLALRPEVSENEAACVAIDQAAKATLAVVWKRMLGLLSGDVYIEVCTWCVNVCVCTCM